MVFDSQGVIAIGVSIVILFGSILYVKRSTSRLKPRISGIYDEAPLMTLIDSMAEGFLAVDAQNKIILHNPAIESIVHKKEITGLHLKEVLQLVNKMQEPVDIGTLINSIGTAHFERNDLSLIHQDGSAVMLDFSISPVSMAPDIAIAGNVTHILVIRDVTEKKNLEEKREEFLSVISHELRTPLATTEANLSMLLNPKIVQLDKRSEHYVAVAHNQVLFLSNILNDITSLSHLDKDTFRTKPVPFNAKKFTEGLRDEFSQKITEKNLLFRCVIGEDLPMVVTTHNEVKQIMNNLLSNAVKYTREGTITLAVAGSHRSQPGILFSVQDTGIGISRSDLKHIFEKFYRSEDYRTRESGGTGLGLYLCKRLAERMKASLWAESELNRGSKFYLFIPKQAAKPENVNKLLGG